MSFQGKLFSFADCYLKVYLNSSKNEMTKINQGIDFSEIIYWQQKKMKCYEASGMMKKTFYKMLYRLVEFCVVGKKETVYNWQSLRNAGRYLYEIIEIEDKRKIRSKD